jgi:signal transduction histidine kinase
MSMEQVFPWWRKLDLELEQAPEEIPILVDGLKHFYTLQISPIRGKRGDLSGRLILFHDHTGEKMASEAIALAQIKTEFLAKVSHELRSPLTSILGLTEMLDYGVYGPLTDQQREAVNLIFTTAQQMTRLVNDLLQQSKLERGAFQLDITQISLTDLMCRLSERARSMAKSKGLDFTCEISAEMPAEIWSDSLRLYQIYSNLVENAIKYTHQGGVQVRVFRQDEQRFTFQVQDTGMGIPEELQELIFNPFQRVIGDPGMDRKESGFGLGLSIVKQLASLMDGEILVNSQVGKGSCFEVTMPLDLRGERQS